MYTYFNRFFFFLLLLLINLHMKESVVCCTDSRRQNAREVLSNVCGVPRNAFLIRIVLVTIITTLSYMRHRLKSRDSRKCSIKKHEFPRWTNAILNQNNLVYSACDRYLLSQRFCER